MKLQPSVCLLVGIAAIGVVEVARGTTVYGDLGGGVYKTTTGGQSIVNPNGYQFTATASGTLSEIDIGINGGGSFSLALYLDNAGAIGPLEWSDINLTNVPNSGTGAPSFAIPILNGPTISAGSAYWLVGSDGTPDVAGDLPLWAPNTTVPLTGGLWYSLVDGVASYQSTSAIGAFQVNATPTPEPSTLLLTATGLAGLVGYGWLRRRRRSNKT